MKEKHHPLHLPLTPDNLQTLVQDLRFLEDGLLGTRLSELDHNDVRLHRLEK